MTGPGWTYVTSLFLYNGKGEVRCSWFVELNYTFFCTLQDTAGIWLFAGSSIVNSIIATARQCNLDKDQGAWGQGTSHSHPTVMSWSLNNSNWWTFTILEFHPKSTTNTARTLMTCPAKRHTAADFKGCGVKPIPWINVIYVRRIDTAGLRMRLWQDITW